MLPENARKFLEYSEKLTPEVEQSFFLPVLLNQGCVGVSPFRRISSSRSDFLLIDPAMPFV